MKKCSYVPPCIRYRRVDTGSGICQASFAVNDDKTVEADMGGWSKKSSIFTSDDDEEPKKSSSIW